MEELLRVLLVEDSEGDAALLLRNLRSGGSRVEALRVYTACAMSDALDAQPWDIVICDYALPGFSGFEALSILRRRDQDTPCIFVSGSLNEEAVVQALKLGAQDYLLKENLTRLVPVVEREVREARERAWFRAERARTEAALRASEAKFRALIENSSDGIFLIGEGKKIAFCSSSVQRILGYTPEELVGYPVQELFHPDDYEAAEAGFAECIMGSADFVTRRVRIRHKDGSWRITDGVCSNLLKDESIRGLVVNFRDVTDAAAAQVAFQKAEERFSIAFTSSPLPIAITTLAEKRFLAANPAFFKTWGYESDEIIGHAADELDHWCEPDLREKVIERLGNSGQMAPFQTKFRTKSGEVRDVIFSADVIELDGVPCLLGTAQDVTEIKQLEARYLQAQKMEAIGRLAGGIAHDFNNLLTVMGGSAYLLQEHKNDQAILSKHAGHIIDAVDRASRLTRQLLAFSRQQVLQPSVLDLNRIIHELVKMIARLLGEDIKVQLHLESGLGSVEIDRGQIEQVIMNLAVNARDAMPDGGKLSVSTASIDMDESNSGLEGLAPGCYVVLSITDTGIGMSAETQSHIFEPFFTTKEIGKGTGLGLATVYGIVKQSNGSISVQSGLGKGTTLKIYLPRVQTPLIERNVDQGASGLNGQETILLAEDDDTLRELFVDYLRSKGYRVIAAGDGPSALKASGEESGTIHALVTDMVMPGFPGHKLAELLLEQRPQLHVIFLSGYTDRASKMQEFKFPSSFLQKPFSLDALARTLRIVLSERNKSKS